MARVKRAMAKRKRKKKFFKLTKGYFGAKSRQYRTVREASKRSGNYAFRDRRARKRDFRRLWITRISAGSRACGVKYGELISAMTKKGIQVNRKMLSELAISDFDAFKKFVAEAVK